MGRIEHGGPSSSQAIACLLSMSLGSQERHSIHTQHKTASVWEGWLQLVHSDTDLSQIAVELAIIEGPQFHLNRRLSPHDPSWKPKERREPLPCCVGIGGWKVAVTNPCRFQWKHEREMS